MHGVSVFNDLKLKTKLIDHMLRKDKQKKCKEIMNIYSDFR